MRQPRLSVFDHFVGLTLKGLIKEVMIARRESDYLF